MKDVLDIHTHSIVSGHAYSTPREMITAAVEKGLKLFGMSEHAPSLPGTCSEMYFHNFRVIDRKAYGIELVMGSELNIIDYNGTIDLPERVLDKLDFAIASMHDLCIKSGSIEQNTKATVEAIKNPYVTIIGHPDDSYFPLDYQQIVAAAKKYHTLLELNSSSLKPKSHRLNAKKNATTMLRLCQKYETPIIIGSDAHIDLDVGNHRYAHALLEELNFPEELVVNTSIEKFKKYLR